MKPAAQDPLAQLTEIRAIMERSSRFISLSGLSGVGAGVVALAGTAIGHYYLQQEYGEQGFRRLFATTQGERLAALPFLLGLAIAMIVAALLVAAFFTLRRTRRDGLRSMWTAPARRLALAMLIPLVAGGLFCLKLFVSGAPELVVPGLLLFYGLALLNGSKYTLEAQPQPLHVYCVHHQQQGVEQAKADHRRQPLLTQGQRRVPGIVKIGVAHAKRGHPVALPLHKLPEASLVIQEIMHRHGHQRPRRCHRAQPQKQ